MTRHRRARRRWEVVAVTLAAAATAVLVTATTVVLATGTTSSAGPDARTSEPTSSSTTSTPPVQRSYRSPTRSAAAAAAETDDRTRPAGLLPRSHPERLLISSIGVDVDVMDLGLTADGTLEVPPGAFPAGWYDGSPTPGELGPAILAGHVHYDGSPGVFARLGELTPGDEVAVLREDDTTAVFTVTSTADFPKSEFPTDTVYGDIDHAGLRLITCGGLDPRTGTYEDNVVVFAELSGARTP